MNIWQCSATAIFGACMMLSPLAVEATPLGPQSGSAMSRNAAQLAPVVDVQYRHHHSHTRHYRSRHWHHDHDDGGALAAGAIFGLAAGALAANAAAGSNAVAYCSQRFRSYDPVSGTYLGYDGYRHPCP